jgi:hypothetical protein
MFGLTPYRRGRSLARRDDLMGVRSIFDDFFSDSIIPEFFLEGIL